MSETLRAAIIGTGDIARTHAGYYATNDRIELVAACDISEQRRTEFCDERGIERRYADYQALLDEVRPEIVSVCTWNATHMPIAIAAMEAGARTVISEKPMSDELGGPMDAVARAAACGCHFVVHHQTRFAPGYCAAKELIAAGAIGTPVSAHLRTGGGLLNMASHLIDSTIWMLGEPAWEYVVGWVQRDTDRFERGSICEEKSHALIGFAGGHELVLSVDMVDGQKHQAFQFVGPEGVINFNREQAVLINANGVHEPRVSPQPGYLDELLAWIDGGPVHRNVASGALETQRIMMAIYESARWRARIEPPFEQRESALDAMVLSGELPCTGAPYDIRKPEAMAWVAAQREGRIRPEGES